MEDTIRIFNPEDFFFVKSQLSDYQDGILNEYDIHMRHILSSSTTHQSLKQAISFANPAFQFTSQVLHHSSDFPSFWGYTLVFLYLSLCFVQSLHQTLCILILRFHIPQQLIWYLCCSSVSQSFVIFGDFRFEEFGLTRNFCCALGEGWGGFVG